MEHFSPLPSSARSWRSAFHAQSWVLRARLARLSVRRWRLRLWRQSILSKASREPLNYKMQVERVSAKLRFCEEARKDCLLALGLARVRDLGPFTPERRRAR